MTTIDIQSSGALSVLLSFGERTTLLQSITSKRLSKSPDLLRVIASPLLGKNLPRNAKGLVSKLFSFFLLNAALCGTAAFAQNPVNAPLTSCSEIGLGQGASLNGFIPFPKGDPWNEVITSLPVAPGSTAIMSVFGGSSMHADFGSGTYAGAKIGIPYQVVSGQPSVTVEPTAYASQSDLGPMPIPANAPVEGAGLPAGTYTDGHVLILDQSNCFLYELFQGALQGDGSWKAASSAIWDLLADNARPFNWTSADAAGLPVFPGLVRYDEVASGSIKHAIRITMAFTEGTFVLPATHETSGSLGAGRPAFGARFRLKPNFNISGFSAANQVILKAMKTYGIIVADNGSTLYISGAPDSRWNNSDLANLGAVKMSDFEMVDTGTTYTPTSIPATPLPAISSLTASTIVRTSAPAPAKGPTVRQLTSASTVAVPNGATVAAGTSVTFTWSATNASYYVLTPGAGAVRGNSVTVTPTATTTYTLHATGRGGSVTKTFTIDVR